MVSTARPLDNFHGRGTPDVVRTVTAALDAPLAGPLTTTPGAWRSLSFFAEAVGAILGTLRTSGTSVTPIACCSLGLGREWLFMCRRGILAIRRGMLVFMIRLMGISRGLGFRS
jgi:hypothetical protein